MIWVDYVIIGVIGFSALVGLARGLVREALSLAAWLAAFAVAWFYHGHLEAFLTPWIGTPMLRMGIAFLILGFVVLIVGAIIGHLFIRLVEKTGLTGTDRLLGMLFGGARGAVLMAMIVFLGALTPVQDDPWWDESTLIGRFQVLAELIFSEIPPPVVDRVKSL